MTIYPIAAPIDVKQARSGSDQARPRIHSLTPIELTAEIRPATSFQSPSMYLTQPLEGNQAYLIPLPDLEREAAQKVQRRIRKQETLYPIPIQKPEAPKETAPLLNTELANRHRIEPANVYSAVDVIAINAQGFIIEIWPNLNLSQLQAPLLLPKHSHAVLYLAANRAGQLGITPKDRIENQLFTPPPVSLQ